MDTREYQTNARRQVNTLLNASRNPVYLAPCGTGKTYTAAAIIEDRNSLDRRVFVLVPQVEIFDEWMRGAVLNHGLNPGYINDEGIRGKARGVYVCMALSLAQRARRMFPESLYPDEIITDEMQHSSRLIRGSRSIPSSSRRATETRPYRHALPWEPAEHSSILYTDVVFKRFQQVTGRRAGLHHQAAARWPRRNGRANVPKNGEDYDAEANKPSSWASPRSSANVIGFYTKARSRAGR
jgi:hypothetical protein